VKRSRTVHRARLLDRHGLAASTVTPGRPRPVVSLTIPAIALCTCASKGCNTSECVLSDGQHLAAGQGARADPHHATRQCGVGRSQRPHSKSAAECHATCTGHWLRGPIGRHERITSDRGIRRLILPCRGPKSPTRRAHERQRWFRRGQRWRIGSERRISVLKRHHGFDRCCRSHGLDGMKRWVGLGVIANNLVSTATFLDARATT
jgi:hypothetical protein